MPGKSAAAGTYRRLAWSSCWRDATPWSIHGRPVPYVGRRRSDGVEIIALGPLALISVLVSPTGTGMSLREERDAARAEVLRLRELLRTIILRSQAAKRQHDAGEQVCPYVLASAILGQIGGEVAEILSDDKGAKSDENP